MKFYNRGKEIETLKKFEGLSAKSSQMTMLLGRRRVGKTTLLNNVFIKTPALYFFIAKKNEFYYVKSLLKRLKINYPYLLGNLAVSRNFLGR